MERVPWIDAAKGIGIILVVVIHTTGNLFVRDLLIAVAIPLFLFLSGFVFKRPPLSEARGFLIRRLQTRILPYALWVVISYCIVALRSARGMDEYLAFLAKMGGPDFLYGAALADFDWLNNTVRNAPLWFLPCLFLVEVLFLAIGGLSSPFRIGLFLAVFSIGTVLLQLYLRKEVPFILDMVMTNAPFFGAGLAVRMLRGSGERLFRGKEQLLVLALGGAALIVAGIVQRPRPFTSFWGIYCQYALSFSGIMFLTAAAGYCGRVRVLRYLGSTTMILLVLNEPLRQAALSLFALIDLSFFNQLFSSYRELFGLLLALAVFALAVPCIFVIRNRLPFLIGLFPPRRPLAAPR